MVGKIFTQKKWKSFYINTLLIQDVQVVGVPDPKYGEELMAWVILKDGENLTSEEVKDIL